MDKSCIVSITTLLVVLQVFLMLIQHARVDASSCPAPCECVFDTKLENNTSICVYNDASINMTWHKLFGRPILSISCQGTNFTCADIPQFDVSHHQASVVMNSCAPSILRCLNGIFRQPSEIESLTIHNLAAPDTKQDWQSLDRVWDLKLYGKDNIESPVNAINSLTSLKKLYVEGGNLQLPLNITSNTTLEHLELKENVLNTIPENGFEALKRTLKSLDISGIQFESLNFQAFKDLLALERLELKYNKIKNLESGETSSNEKRNLKLFKMDNNTLSHLPNKIFVGYDSLDKILIQNNQVELKLDTEALSRLSPSIKTVQLINCKIRNLPKNVFLGSSNVYQMDINDNLLESLDPGVFNTTLSTRRIDLSGNRIKTLPATIFSRMKKLSILDLSYNSIEKLNEKLFNSNPLLTILYLQNNNINELGRDLFERKKFQRVSLASNKLKNIEGLHSTEKISSWTTKELDLSNNQIEIFQEWLLDIPKLENLDLSSNKLKILSNKHFSISKSNVVINLRNNEISRIVNGDTASREAHESNKKITLYLSNNPFECDCQSVVIFKKWYRENIIGDYENLTCIDGVKISTIDVHTHCNKIDSKIIVICINVIGIILGLVLFFIIYKRRQVIVKYIRESFTKRTPDESVIMNTKQNIYKPHDIFITCHHQDEKTLTTLLAKLENEYSQKVSMYNRDFYIGEPQNVISELMDKSKVIVVLLSENYLTSNFTLQEFLTAYNMKEKEGKQIILILLDKSIVKMKQLCDEMKSCLANNSHLLWGDRHFWAKFVKLLTINGLEMNNCENEKLQNNDVILIA